MLRQTKPYNDEKFYNGNITNDENLNDKHFTFQQQKLNYHSNRKLNKIGKLKPIYYM